MAEIHFWWRKSRLPLWKSGKPTCATTSTWKISSRVSKHDCDAPVKVTVWGCTSATGVDGLKLWQKWTLRNIPTLETRRLPLAKDMFTEGGSMFRDGNAPCHRAKVLKNWSRSREIMPLEWPGQVAWSQPNGKFVAWSSVTLIEVAAFNQEGAYWSSYCSLELNNLSGSSREPGFVNAQALCGCDPVRGLANQILITVVILLHHPYNVYTTKINFAWTKSGISEN